MIKKQAGQLLILVLISLGVILFVVLFTVGGSQVYFQNSQHSYEAEVAQNIAEAGVDKAVASLNKTGGTYNGESETVLGEGSYSVAVTNKDSANKILTVTGYVPNKLNPKIKRVVTVQATNGVGFAFNYGIQVGEGGIIMGNSSNLNGSIYSNGNIVGGNSNLITGDVFVAGGGSPSADQESDCVGANCVDYIFGKSVSGESPQDVAQSFKRSVTNTLNKISVKIKKTGNPSNPTVRIMKDNGGKPDKNDIVTSGTLSSSSVSTSAYGFVDVTFSSTPTLSSGTTYWIMIHSNSLDNSNYWYWSNDLAQSYSNGLSKWSSNWQASTPIWTTINGDLGFKTYMGGVATSLTFGNSSVIAGNVHANTITGGSFTINKDAYYQTLGSSVTVKGSKYPGSSDPPPATFPVSEANIADWQTQAEAGGITNGNITGCNMVLGPKKIVGNLTIGSSCTVTVKSPLWITGNVVFGNSSQFVLDASLGASSGLVMVDGITTFGNSCDIKGSGTSGSYLMYLSTYDSIASGSNAINTGNSTFSGIFYAPKGKISLPNSSQFKEITAYQLILGNSSQLTYDSGMASTVFSSGPSGAFSLVKGSYQIK